MGKKVEISKKTIIFTVLFLIALWFLYMIRDIVAQVFVALILMTTLNPGVKRLSRILKIPRSVAILVIYFVIIATFVFVVATIIPVLVEQTTSLANSLPRYLIELKIPQAITDQITAQFTSQLGNLTSQLLQIVVSLLSNIVAILVVFIFALYLLLSRDKFDDKLALFLKERQAQRVNSFIDKLEIKLGGWARGELLLMLMVGVFNYIGLTVLGVPFALPLALLAGMLELVPNVGPIIAAVPAVIVGFGVSPVTGLATIALAFLVQQVENYVFVPKVMQRSAGVDPVVTLLAIFIGFKLAGVMGAIISVPVALTIQVALEEFSFDRKQP